jgi:hypothetical protein
VAGETGTLLANPEKLATPEKLAKPENVWMTEEGRETRKISGCAISK